MCIKVKHLNVQEHFNLDRIISPALRYSAKHSGWGISKKKTLREGLYRMIICAITKVSNVYDRPIAATLVGIDALLEAERVK